MNPAVYDVVTADIRAGGIPGLRFHGEFWLLLSTAC
jgi:hypothetical protein